MRKILTFKYKNLIFGVKLLLFIFVIFQSTEVRSQDEDMDWFWFLYEQESNRNFDTFVIRPFYLNNYNKQKKRTYAASLPPLLFWKNQTLLKTDRHWLLGLAGDVDYTHLNGVRDYDAGLFPFLYYGDSPAKSDQYFLFWPIGGTIRGKLAQDKISPWVFPGAALFYLYPPSGFYMWVSYLALSFVPVYVSYNQKDYHAQAIFWPLIQWGESKTRKDFRILPFYAHNYKKGFYDNRSYLTLINYQKIILGENRTLSTFFVLPLFGRRWSSQKSSGASTLLWPFFSWGYNKSAGSFELNFPWPLVQYQTSENPYVRKKIFFPFYGYYYKNKQETKFITPLYFTLKSDLENVKSEYYITCFIFWYFKRDYKRSPSAYYGNSWRYFKVWPLFHYEYNDKGAFSFRTLSLLPFRDPEGYEKMYSPFWSLFEYSRSATGVKKLGVLFRTYYQYWGDSFFKSKVPVLFTYYSYNNKIAEFTFLLSMFGYKWTQEGKYLKIFWFPIRIGEGRKDIAKKIEPDKVLSRYSDEELYYRTMVARRKNESSGQNFILIKRNIF